MGRRRRGPIFAILSVSSSKLVDRGDGRGGERRGGEGRIDLAGRGWNIRACQGAVTSAVMDDITFDAGKGRGSDSLRQMEPVVQQAGIEPYRFVARGPRTNSRLDVRGTNRLLNFTVPSLPYTYVACAPVAQLTVRPCVLSSLLSCRLGYYRCCRSAETRVARR